MTRALTRYSAPGSAAAYDDLTLAANLFDGSEVGLRALRSAAINCGLPVGADVVAWVHDRLDHYLNTVSQGRAELAASLVCAAYAKNRDGPDFHIVSKRA